MIGRPDRRSAKSVLSPARNFPHYLCITWRSRGIERGATVGDVLTEDGRVAKIGASSPTDEQAYEKRSLFVLLLRNHYSTLLLQIVVLFYEVYLIYTPTSKCTESVKEERETRYYNIIKQKSQSLYSSTGGLQQQQGYCYSSNSL